MRKRRIAHGSQKTTCCDQPRSEQYCLANQFRTGKPPQRFSTNISRQSVARSQYLQLGKRRKPKLHRRRRARSVAELVRALHSKLPTEPREVGRIRITPHPPLPHRAHLTPNSSHRPAVGRMQWLLLMPVKVLKAALLFILRGRADINHNTLWRKCTNDAHKR